MNLSKKISRTKLKMTQLHQTKREVILTMKQKRSVHKNHFHLEINVRLASSFDIAFVISVHLLGCVLGRASSVVL